MYYGSIMQSAGAQRGRVVDQHAPVENQADSALCRQLGWEVAPGMRQKDKNFNMSVIYKEQ